MKKRGILSIIALYLAAFWFFAGAPNVFAATCSEDWTCTKNNSTKTVYLTKYTGTAETYQVPAKMTIDGEEYTVVLGNSYSSSTRPFADTTVKHLSVEPGVQIKYPGYLFSNTTNLESVDLTGADTSTATSVSYMFSGATNLKKVVMSGLDLSKITSDGKKDSPDNHINKMFYNASNIEEIDFSNTNMSGLASFAYSSPANNYASTPFFGMQKLKKVNFNNFNTASLTSAQSMFLIDATNSEGENQNHLEEIDLTNWNIENVTNLSSAFKHCGENNPITIKGLDTLNTAKVTNFSGTFQSTYKVTDLTGVGSWDTSSATNMHSMFSQAKSITTLDLSNWDTSNVTDIGSMFVSCEKLTDLNVSTWDTSKVKAMDTVFKGCASLEVLDLSSWTSESVENKAGSHMWEMFGAQRQSSEYPLTPLKEITLNENFTFKTWQPPSLRGGYWHLKEGTDEQVSKKYSPGRLYTAYNNRTTPGDGYTYSHTYVLTELDPATAEYYAHGWGDNNVWEVHYPDDKFKGYCINLHRGSPSGYYDRTKILGDEIISEGFLDSTDYGWAPLGDNMREALITLIYYGYGNDADGIQAKYGLTDSEFLLITQQAIWDFTDRYSNMPERDATTKYGQAHYELVSKRFADIPNNDQLKLYLYESIDGKQNLLSISGLADQAYAGVRVLKLVNEDDALVPLLGAEFSIRNSDGEEVATIISDENGYATKYNTDSVYGLPEGIYTITESKVPRGYAKVDINNFCSTKYSQYPSKFRECVDNLHYTFIVRPEDDNEIILVGKLSGQGDDTAMIFENTNDTTVEGGGVTVTVTDRKTGALLMGARFEVYDENGNLVTELTSDANGFAKSSKKLLELGKNYTIKEVQAPAGYKLNTKVVSFVNYENETYVDTFFDHALKKCQVTVEATKKYNRPLTNNLFQFELLDNSGAVVATAGNNTNGQVKFNLNYTGADLGFATYTLREQPGTNQNITYDPHSTELTVTISDDGEDELACGVSYDYGQTVFTNTANSTVIPGQDGTTPKTPQTGFHPLGLSTTTLKTSYFIFALFSLLSILMCKNRIRKS